MSVASVQVKAGSPFRVRREAIAVRSSTMCTAFTAVVCATRGSSVKPLEVIEKLAVTARAALIVTVQAPVPVQLPLQPVKVEPAPGAAVSVTTVPGVKEAEHVAPQEIPAGLLVTVPLPAPALETVSVEPVDTPVPVTNRDIVSPSAVKLTFVLDSTALIGAKRTVTVAVAPVPTRVKGLPETMVKGAGTEAVPVMVPERVL